MRRYFFLFAGLLPAAALASTPISLSKPVSESIQPNGIYWTFDEGTPDTSEPATAPDHSGNQYDGALLPGAGGALPVYVAGRFGHALRFAGSDPEKLDPHIKWDSRENPGSDETRMDMSGQSFTAGAWIRFNALREGEDQRFILFDRFAPQSDSTGIWNLWIYKSADNRWRLRVHLPGHYRDGVPSEVDLGDGEWHHIGLNAEVSNGETLLTFWVDGENIGSPAPIPVALPMITEDGAQRFFSVGERNQSYHFSDMDASVDDVFVTSGIHFFAP